MLVVARRRTAWQSGVHGAWGLAVVLGLSACAGGEARRISRESHPAVSSAVHVARQERETDMNRQWQNKSLAELTDALGRPKMVLAIPGGGMPPSYVVVYGPDPSSGCIDAFAVNLGGDPVVRIYHCR